MAKRFARYKFALKAVDGVAPETSPLGKYQKYRKGETQVNYPSNEASNPKELVQIILAPFSVPPDTKYAAQMSKRAFDKMADLVSGSPATLFHHLTQGTDSTTQVNPGYSPAKAIIQISGSGTTNEISQITGVTYKKETGAASYTVAFGGQLSAGDNRYFLNVVNNIKGAVKAKNSEYTVSFSPEVFRLK